MDTLTLARDFASLLLDTAAKGTALLLLAVLATWLCRRSSAALRHSIWCMTMGGLLLLPVAAWALPAWQIPILPPEPVAALAPVAEVVRLSTPSPAQGATGEGFDSPVLRHSTAGATVLGQETFKDTGGPERPPLAPSAAPVVAPTPAPTRVKAAPPLTAIEWTSLLVSALWSLGVSLFGVLLLVGLWRTVQLRRASLTVHEGEWPDMLVELRQRLGLSRSVELREHAQSVVPLTWGIVRPVVLLPKLARAWDEPMRRAVLLHELAHVQRGDVACQVLGRLTCVLYWFHPLAWFALRQLRQEREQACDDAVVQSGEKASDYAEQLLQVARLCCAPRGLSLGVAMAEGSSLETRVKSLFDTARGHGPVSRRVAIVSVLVGIAILCGLAPIQPTASEAKPVAVGSTFEKAFLATVDIATQKEPSVKAMFFQSERPKINGMGSGIIIDERGYIVTAYHVVDGVKSIKITLHDGTTLPASVVGQDPVNDLAMLRIHPTQPLTVMPEQHTEPVKVTDEVTAIGNAFGWNHTVSRGIISGMGRDVELSETQSYKNLIQIDIPLNPGNSGGPLLNAKGEAIGINIAIRAGGQRIGFAIPIQDARKVYVGLMGRIITGPAAREQMELLKPVFGETKRGIQLGVAVASIRQTFPSSENIPLWLFYQNMGDKELTFNTHHDFMAYPPGVKNERGETVQVSSIMHFMDIPPTTITLKPGEVWCIATPGLNLSEQVPGMKPLAGKYKLTYSEGIWDVNTTPQLRTDLPTPPTTIPDTSLPKPGSPDEPAPATSTPVGQMVETPNWSENLTTGTIEFEIAPSKTAGSLEARILANLPTDGSSVGDSPVPDNTRDSRVSGRVENARGAAVPQALVLYPYDVDKATHQWRVARTVANERGEFELTIPKPESDSDPRTAPGIVWSWAKGHGVGTANMAETLVTKKQVPVRIVLPETEPSQFRILSEDAKPLAGVSVTPDQIRVPNGTAPVDGLYALFHPVPEELRKIAARQTDADGRVTLDLVPHKLLSDVRVITTSHGEQIFTYPKEELKLHPVVPVEGTLAGHGEGVHLTFSSVGRHDSEANFDVVTGANGSFSIPAFPEGTFDVSSFDLQPPVFLNRPRTVLSTGDASPIVLSTTTGIPVKGRLVVRGTNRGVPNARMSVRSGFRLEYATDCTSNENGEFSSFAVPGQRLRIQVYSLGPVESLMYPGFQEFTKTEFPSDAREFTVPDIALDPAKMWNGKLVDEAGTPIEGVYAVPRLGEKELEQGARTSSGGAFQVALKAGVTPDSWHVIWDASLPKPQTVPAEVVSQDPLVLRTQRVVKPTEAPAVGLKHDAAPQPATEDLIPLDKAVWWGEAVDGLEPGFWLAKTEDPRNLRVPMDSLVKYRVVVRNTTDKELEFLVRLLPFDGQDVPYLIPSSQLDTKGKIVAPQPAKEFQAQGAAKELYGLNAVQAITLDAGESVLLPECGLYFGKAPDEQYPQIADFVPGTHWIVQPLLVHPLTFKERGEFARLMGRDSVTKIARDGKTRQEGVVYVTGSWDQELKPAYAKYHLEVGTLDASADRNAKSAIWGEVEQGMQCGIRILNPQATYQTGDTLEAELLWRNTSDAVISTTRPRPLDLYSSIEDAEGNHKLIDFGARYDLPPGGNDFEPSEVRSLGVTKVTLVVQGTPGPKDNKEPGHITLEPGKYKLSGSGGVGNINPLSGKYEFTVVSHAVAN